MEKKITLTYFQKLLRVSAMVFGGTIAANAQTSRFHEELLTEPQDAVYRSDEVLSPELMVLLASEEPAVEAHSVAQEEALPESDIQSPTGEAAMLADQKPPEEPLSQPDMHDLAGRGKDGPAPADPQATGNSDNNNNQEPIGEKSEQKTAEKVFLRTQSILLKAREGTLELGLLYTKTDNQQSLLRLDTWMQTLIQTVPIGILNKDLTGDLIDILKELSAPVPVPNAQIDQDSFVSNFTLRYGLVDNLQAFASVPLIHQSTMTSIVQSTDTKIDTEVLSDVDSTEWGDVTLGMQYAVLKEGSGYPSVILSGVGQIPTRDSPPNIGGNVALTKSFDPAVLFANIGFNHSFNDDVALRFLLPDNSMNATVGVAYSLNDTLTLSTSVLGVFDGETSANEIVLPSGKRGEVELLSDEHYFLRLGLTAFLTNELYVEPNVSFNLSDTVSTAAFGLNLPYSFSL